MGRPRAHLRAVAGGQAPHLATARVGIARSGDVLEQQPHQPVARLAVGLAVGVRQRVLPACGAVGPDLVARVHERVLGPRLNGQRADVGQRVASEVPSAHRLGRLARNAPVPARRAHDRQAAVVGPPPDGHGVHTDQVGGGAYREQVRQGDVEVWSALYTPKLYIGCLRSRSNRRFDRVFADARC
jgi:hypothetical protein